MIVQKGFNLSLTEFKSTQTIMSDLFKGLQYFENLAKSKSLTKSLVYTGSESQQRTRTEIISWNKLWI